MSQFLVFCALVACVQTVWGQTVIIEPEYTSVVNSSVIFNIKKPLNLNCNVVAEGVTPDSIDVQWEKDGQLVGEVAHLNGRFKTSRSGSKFTLTVESGDYGDVGRWTCSALVNGENKAASDIQVATTIFVKIKADNINVVEEEKLRIECSVLGKPPPALSWTIFTENYNGSDFDERVSIEDLKDDAGNVIENSVLIINNVDKKDRGKYHCKGVNKYYEKDSQETSSMVRIKDKYAALWPFLGICAEVIILCAVIIIYEKKRNKSELEESDTDQSPDQKNTPDHGKDANLRHRQ